MQDIYQHAACNATNSWRPRVIFQDHMWTNCCIYGISSFPARIKITSITKCEMKLLIHSQTSTAVDSHFCPIMACLTVWSSCQMREIACCACAGNAGKVFPVTDYKANRWWRSRHASRHVRPTRAVMHAGIANPRWRGKRSRKFRRMRNPQFYVSCKRPMPVGIAVYNGISYHLEAQTRWPPVLQTTFQMHFLDQKLLYFNSNFTEVCS